MLSKASPKQDLNFSESTNHKYKEPKQLRCAATHETLHEKKVCSKKHIVQLYDASLSSVPSILLVNYVQLKPSSNLSSRATCEKYKATNLRQLGVKRMQLATLSLVFRQIVLELLYIAQASLLLHNAAAACSRT
jgi:hypothetical protein